MADYSQASGNYARRAPSRAGNRRKKFSPAIQWILSVVLMGLIFAVYFDLCLIFTRFNLFDLTAGAKWILLLVLAALSIILIVLLALYGDWKRPVIALLVCLTLYIPANYSNLGKIPYLRTLWIQTAYSTMRHQGLMHLFLPWITDAECKKVDAAKLAQVGHNSTAEHEDTAEDILSVPDFQNEIVKEIEEEDPGFDALTEEQKRFYTLFYELDRDSCETYLAEHTAALENGYANVLINHSALGDQGTSIRTKLGEKVLAIDAANGILIVEIDAKDRRSGTTSRAVLAVAKDPSRLRLCPATTLPHYGQVVGKIAQANGGVLAMTGSGFIDEGGVGNGGQIAGFAMCSGVTYGDHYGYGYKRIELHENNWFYIADAYTKCGTGTTDCMEFQPSLFVDGVRQDIGAWYEVNPRACIGQSKYGEILMLCVEGRRSDSPGCSLETCSDILERHRAETAMNCDGGTTAILWFRGSPIIRCSNSAIPQGRYLPNAWVYQGK